jgi:hypothetical protein
MVVFYNNYIFQWLYFSNVVFANVKYEKHILIIIPWKIRKVLKKIKNMWETIKKK